MKRKQYTMQELEARYLNNTADCGRHGRYQECVIREYLNGKVERVHPQTMADVNQVGRGYAIEIKTGRGWIIDAIDDFTCKDDVTEYMEATKPQFWRSKTNYIVYMQDGKADINTARVWTAQEFFTILAQCGLIEVTQHTSGNYGAKIMRMTTGKKRVFDFYESAQPNLEEFRATLPIHADIIMI